MHNYEKCQFKAFPRMLADTVMWSVSWTVPLLPGLDNISWTRQQGTTKVKIILKI